MLNMGYPVVLLIVFLCHELFALSSSINQKHQSISQIMSFSVINLPHHCPKDESISLLKFKKTFTVDPSSYDYCQYYGQPSYPKTSTWNMSRDCCLWDGVICDEMTGHVIELDLSCSNLVGTIDSNSSLFQLSHLQRLNLSYNDFFGSQISPEFGRFSGLTHLDLYDSSFSGQIPSEISHLSKLQSLFFSGYSLRIGPLNFKLLIQNLTQLRHLDLTIVNISSTIPLNYSSHLTTLRLGETNLYGIIPESIFHLPNLEKLDLQFNDQLSGYFPTTKWNSSVSLRELILDDVNFSGNLPESLGYLTSVHSLSLQNCRLRGPIPESLSNLTRIEDLELGRNSMNGAIPSWMFSLPSLSELVLSNNHFSGQLEDFKSNTVLIDIDLEGNQLQDHLPKSIQNLVNLTRLILSFNNFSGNVDVGIFSNLKHLRHLELSYNRISLTNENKVKSNLPESLVMLRLASCEVKELEFLRSAKHLGELDLSNNKLQGRIPDWAWSNWMFSVENLNLSHNMLTSMDSIPLQRLDNIDLRSNFLKGSLPIPANSARFFFISENNLSEEIPSSICNLMSLVMLELARNNLRGAIPQCLGNISSLLILDMHHNNIFGTLPTTFRNGSSLRSINLHGNKLEGEIPRSLANCKKLQVLDLGDNHLIGTFPMWLGTLPNLQVLSLSSNKLHGSIRTSRIKNMFPELRVIDLSYNAFSGNLRTSLFQHLKATRTIDQTMRPPRSIIGAYYQDSVIIATKGLELEIVRILYLYTVIDLSSNRFGGNIPSIMGDLIGLHVLNLSHNELEGHIPSSLGKLSVVESLDLSVNHLTGEIPQQLISLTSLEFLNLSYNRLQGCIPQGRQFATFENNSYKGNDGLRGFPVLEGCGSSGMPETNNTMRVLDQENNSTFLSEFRMAILMGYGSGLIIGISIAYFMLSSRNPNWLSWIAEELEYIIVMRRRKKQRGHQRQYRR